MKKLTEICTQLALGFTVVAISIAASGVHHQAYAMDVEVEDDEIASMEEGPIVRRQLLHRSGRLEIEPKATFSLNDSFIRNVMPGLNGTYFLNNTIGLAGSFHFGALGLDTSLRRNMEAGLDQSAMSETAYSRIGWTADFGLVYVPMFGKFSVMNSFSTHYDVHLMAGGAVLNEVGVSASGDGDIDPELEGLRPGGMFGAGMRVFLSDMVSLNFQVRNFVVSRSRQVSQGNADLRLGNTVMFSTGVGIYWPGEVRIAR